MFETCGLDVYESVVDGSVLVKVAEEEIMLVALVQASELVALGLVPVDEGSFDVDVSGVAVKVDDWNVESDDPGSIEEPSGSS